MESDVFDFVGSTCTLVLMLSGPIKGHRHGKSANQQRPSRDQLWEQPRPDLEIASSLCEAGEWLRSCGTCSSLSTHPQHLLPPHEMLLQSSQLVKGDV